MPKTLLRELSARAIVASIASAADRWHNADYPPRVRVTAAIEARLGYTIPVIDYALDALFGSLTEDAIAAAIVGELGSLDALDGFAPQHGRPDAFARGVERVAVISSDTTIGVALIPAIYALCAKCDVTVKDRSDDLIAAFFSSLVEERPEFRAAARAHVWSGGDDEAERTIIANADTVIAFGTDEAMRAIRGNVRPDARFISFGHRMSVGYVDAASLQPDGRTRILEGVARDALLYDGEGCLSLHALFVAGDPAQTHYFTKELAAVFESVAVEFPAGSLDAGRAAAVASYRNLAAFRAAGEKGVVYTTENGRTVIAFDPARSEPPPLLPRVLPVYPVSGVDDARQFITEHRLPVMALGVADAFDSAATALAQAVGAVRITPFGSMQSPPPGGHHGGSPRIADFVRWIDREW
jgi:hypothetical protein